MSRGSSVIALQSDEWFLALLSGIDRNLGRAHEGLVDKGRAALDRTKRWLPRLSRSQPPRERIRRAIAREAKRHGIDPEQPGVSVFSERIAAVVEMVLLGTLSVDDVAFEEAEPNPGATASETSPTDGRR